MRCDCLGVLSTSNTYRSFIYCPHFDSMLGLPRLESDCENLYPNNCFRGPEKRKGRALAPTWFSRLSIRNRAIVRVCRF